MDIALLLVVNCKSDIIFDKTMQLHDIGNYCIMTCSNIVFYYEFIHKYFVYRQIKLVID